MEIQNISGPDIVPSGFSVKSEIPNESVRIEQEQTAAESPPPEENKGTYVDTYA